jgi:hypothetical protein
MEAAAASGMPWRQVANFALQEPQVLSLAN